MEAMSYSYFSTAPQPFQYVDYDADNGMLPKDGVGVTPSFDAADVSTFALGSYDFNPFDATNASDMSPQLHHTGSVSPRAHHLPPFKSGSVDSGIALDLDHERSRRNSSEEKENLTPAQSRRKAQNRAAQRAFRERKERHVRDLEAKLTLLTTTTSSLQSDNERLKLLLQRAQTENEILRANAASSRTRQRHILGFVDDPSLLTALRQSHSSPSAEEQQLKPIKLADGLLSTEPSSPQFPLSPGSDSHLLSASATWNLLQSHPSYRSGAMDISEVCKRIKKLARCEGMGPMFDEEEVKKVIEKVGKSGAEDCI
ncbi:Putative basic-leucine zipper domain, transcription factor PAP1, Yap1 redox domain superfamily [Septoria linicola]|uniref:Basic-leucine zipper domain, transcription factor PAP1, Yap1 redox domain superfamily n=1 Tax=Septoria linicola TaxID=215465 RepID=A0A9Q9AU55_9PEZI|nr:putative basic-leucine zipper domain, transcription factor PAP1, Yap1 redox domain superfamily [Septoria linicola]USW50771.1 Putative basic-leucine zipper domain, transcription factor PAP1, Yap1 redox domain superfamily [Septoria linicola]